MSEDNSRDVTLRAIRRAAAGWRPDAPPAFSWRAESLSPGELVARFVGRAEAAQAFVSFAADFDGALQRTADILSELEAQQVIVSGDAWGPPWGIERLADAIEDCTIRPTASLNDTSPAAIAGFAYAGITAASYAMADTGTIVVCSGPDCGRIESLLPPIHVALVRASDMVSSLADLMAALRRGGRCSESSAVTFITGPSRTADIELTLTLGVHGPKQLYIVIVNDMASPATA